VRMYRTQWTTEVDRGHQWPILLVADGWHRFVALQLHLADSDDISCSLGSTAWGATMYLTSSWMLPSMSKSIMNEWHSEAYFPLYRCHLSKIETAAAA